MREEREYSEDQNKQMQLESQENQIVFDQTMESYQKLMLSQERLISDYQHKVLLLKGRITELESQLEEPSENSFSATVSEDHDIKKFDDSSDEEYSECQN